MRNFERPAVTKKVQRCVYTVPSNTVARLMVNESFIERQTSITYFRFLKVSSIFAPNLSVGCHYYYAKMTNEPFSLQKLGLFSLSEFLTSKRYNQTMRKLLLD